MVFGFTYFINFGKNTNVIPSVTSVGTTTGVNAVFSVLSNDIAKIEDTDVTVQGWEFSKNKAHGRKRKAVSSSTSKCKR